MISTANAGAPSNTTLYSVMPQYGVALARMHPRATVNHAAPSCQGLLVTSPLIHSAVLLSLLTIIAILSNPHRAEALLDMSSDCQTRSFLIRRKAKSLFLLRRCNGGMTPHL